MDYKEKSELTEEIKTSAKRSIKTCVILGILAVIVEIILIGGFLKALSVNITGFDVFLFAYLYCVVRYAQLWLISGFNAE